MSEPQGTFIWAHTDVRGVNRENELFLFRKRFICAANPLSLIINISADSRYRLFCNGRSVSSGPCKGSRFTTYYDVIDLSAYLQEGENLLAVKVLHYPPIGENLSVWRYPLGMVYVAGELIYRNGERQHVFSDGSWLCREDLSTRFLPGNYATMFLGGTEFVQGSLIPHRWQELEYDDGDWDRCEVYHLVDTTTGVLEPWQLTERVIPLLYEQLKDFVRLTYSEHVREPDEQVLRALSSSNEQSLVFGPSQRYVLEIDAGELSTGYVMLAVSGGAGSTISILCAECYEFEPIEIPWQRNKGLRDDVENGRLYGDPDQYVVAGVGTSGDRQYERYEPLLFKTFRYIRLEITVIDEPLILHSVQYRATGYPLDTQAAFHCSDSTLNTLWDISLTTLERCMHESYEDCPYYEQFQYTQDTFLQTLFTYQVSGDDRLARKAIHDFHSSLLPQGLLQSRFPSIEPQIIPGFTIYWILMIYEHYQYFHDVELIRRYSPTIDAVLGWFDRQLNSDGLVDDIPDTYWQFVDWVSEWRDLRGVPAAAKTGPLTVYNLMYALGLQKAAELNSLIRRDGIAQEYLMRSQAVTDSVLTHCWSEQHQFFKDGPDTETYSQHAQIWAVLAHAVIGDAAVKLMEDTLAADHLAEVSYAMTFFLLRALSQTGLYHRSFDLWDPWRSMIQMHLTTWAEDPVTQRSDCHAWGSLPLYEFTTELLGVRPSEDSAEVITIRPEPGDLLWAQGVVVTAFGLLHIRWQMTSGTFWLTLHNPSNITVRIIMPDGTRHDDTNRSVIGLEQHKE